MHIIAAIYLFVGGAYSAWNIRRTKKPFNFFKDYFYYIVVTTFLWPLLLLKDVVLKIFHFVTE